MPRTLTIALVVWGLLAVYPTWGLAAGKPAPSATAVRSQAESAVTVRAATQKLAEEFAARKTQLLDRIEALQAELETLTAQRK